MKMITHNLRMGFGLHIGQKFSWIVRNAPEYVRFAKSLLPDCGVDLLRLVEFAEFIELKERWRMRRRKQRAWKLTEFYPTEVHGCKKVKIDYYLFKEILPMEDHTMEDVLP